MEDGWVADPDYEFSAPHYFDFVRGETEEEAQDAQNWFHTAATYPASPYVAKIKERETLSDETKESLDEVKGVGHEHPDTNMDISALNFDDPTSNQGQDMTEDMEICTPRGQVNTILGQETVKRVPPFSSKSTLTKPTASHLAKRIDSSVRGRREVKSMKQVKGRCTPTVLVNKEKVAEKSAAEENQAVKRQKLDGGRLRQIHNVKEQVLPHKVSSALKDLSASKEKIVRAHNERGFTASSKGESADGVSRPVQLKLTVPKEPALVTAQRSRPVRVKSTAELEEELLAKMQKFKARPLNKKILEASSLPLPPKSVPQLPVFQVHFQCTIAFVTLLIFRPSSYYNALLISTSVQFGKHIILPYQVEYYVLQLVQEFNLKTSERAMQHCAATSSISSSTDSVGITEKHHLKSALGGGLTEPRMPHLETALRARPPKVKSSEELQKEELENFPKFKARPLNKKIFSSRGDLGVFRHFKRQVTKPEEFHFSTDERCHSSPAPADLFMKLSLNSEPSHDAIVRPTKPKPFHLLTEERGAEKERKLMLELQEQENKEHEARIPKANPLPYTIDFPVIPPKPEPKECTKPEPFQLESLVRHEEELQRMVEERARAERKEAEIRKFRAQPIKSNVPVHIPEVPRMPLTEVQEFTFHVDARAVERMEFDKKVLEKQNMYKRYREEYEAAKKADEERDIKIMRKAMVPHARPMPHFTKPFVPERSSKDLTEPKSPKFCALQHKYDGWLSTLTTQKR